jgi:DNA invertase Pin-like site-specific DNA recombinase
MTDRKLRAVAYVRESTEEQGQGFSPDAQREGIRRFAPENDLELIGEYCRFARNQVEARRYKQLLRERLGIRVVSVTQPMGEDHTDPSAFLAESIHEMFDEYYSVSLSFWTRSGLKEKARQGHLVGSLPWGYVRDPATKLATTHPERAPLVLQLFERYATGQESDRTVAAWLNAKGTRTARGRLFSKDAVREMLCSAAYAGYVSGLRDKSRSIRGLHEAIVSDELFDRVQEVRSWRTRVVKPGRPSEEYLLRKLIHCERCGARMHGCRTGWQGMRRCQCSTRRHHGDCEQKMTPAQPLEEQLIAWLHDFQPDHALRQLVLDAIQAQAGGHPGEDAERRRELTAQLQRLRDLYVMGDITKPQYVMQRQLLEEDCSAPRLQPTPTSTGRKQSSKTSRTSGMPSTSRPSDASSCSPCSRRYGPRTTRSSPSNPTLHSPATSPPRRRCEQNTQKPTRTMRQQRRGRRGSNPVCTPHRNPLVMRRAVAD